MEDKTRACAGKSDHQRHQQQGAGGMNLKGGAQSLQSVNVFREFNETKENAAKDEYSEEHA
jgi:hypothetical protein